MAYKADKYVLEVCVDSIDSAVAAEEGGADRLELCAALGEGGLTPSVGLFKIVKKAVKIPIFVMIRPRSGDFLYNENELEIMKEDIKIFKELEADGFVFGCLKRDGTVNKNECQEMMKNCHPYPVTFHRAIDVTPDLNAAIEDVIDCGFKRVLTSGGESTAFIGVKTIASLVSRAKNRIIVMAGTGVNVENVSAILLQSGVTEVHGSASKVNDSEMLYRKSNVSMGGTAPLPEYCIKKTDPAIVAQLTAIVKECI